MRLPALLASVCLALPGIAIAADTPAGRCADLYRLSDMDNAVEAGVLVSASDAAPAHCRVRGTIDATIRFEVRMPVEGWTGRFMFHAPGGLAGVIGDTSSLLGDGFAMATTDTGHEAANEPTFYRDDHAKLNFAFRANHLTTVLAKRIVAAFYGQPVQYAYLWGCSNGGRAALVEALRYPDDYDGIIAGAPAIEYSQLLAWAFETSRHQARGPLGAESVALLDANTRRACDLLDGVADGVVGDPRTCTVEMLELDVLACEDSPASDCLTTGQIETARYIYTGITDESGAVVVPGVYPGGELGGDFDLWVTGPVPFLEGTASDVTVDVIEAVMHREPDFDIASFDPVRNLPRLREVMYSVEVPMPDFSAFQESGGKLIIYNGWHDQPCRAKTLELYLADAEELNGADALDEFLRTYMIPGMVHCAGGPGAWAADFVQPIVDWVEDDVAPDRIIAEHPGDFTFMDAQTAIAGRTVNWSGAILEAGKAQEDARRFSRPLCPYPQYARYTGSGDTDDAANYACVED
ncbi:MAG: tannase/feruloyl esterase family alpha/beta hydrolase [Gammaproteobacteria bacterium]|nr:tannase/feruloyl esterase family alpha/beta hydrolase [Gammaproteobacteria bacterium]